MSKLFLVSTPIGNLGDLTHRAEDVLRQASRILAEDTRRTAILCRRYGIDTPLVSAHAHNEQARVEQVLAWLDAGEDIAVVSDAGTPVISDPGARLVRAAADAGHTVVPVPGPSAVLAALAASGIPSEPFTFFGFLPRRGREREQLLDRIAQLEHAAVLFEAPRRIRRLLGDLVDRCSASRPVCVAREMTKLHESFFRGTLAEAQAYYDDATIRGEFVVVLGGETKAAHRQVAAEDAGALLLRLLSDGHKPSSAAREAARLTGMTRADAYRLAIRCAEARKGVVE